MDTADDFMIDFENFVRQKGYDLSSIIQYKISKRK